jgi:hypothetical protein
LDAILSSVNQFVDGLFKNSNINVQVSIISFNKTASVASYLSSDYTSVKFSIDNLSIPSTYPEYRTDIYGALQLANNLLTTTILDNSQPKSLFDLCNNLNSTILKAGSFKITRNIPRSLSKKSIILFSDGYENINVGKAVPYAKSLISSGMEIFGVDIGVNSYFTTNMEQMASVGGFFNLQNYLDNSDGDINSFVQYLLSRFSADKFSATPVWYKAVRSTNGNWIGTNQISDMVLNSGDFISFVHRSDATYSGTDNTSFSTPAISFTFNIELNGWDYFYNSFSKNNIGQGYGAKPFWAKSYTSPQENLDTHFDKGSMSFGGQVRFIDDYLPVHQPEISDMILTNGSYMTYSRKADTNLIWNQPLTFEVSLSSYSWNKINFYKDISNLSDMFRNGNNIDAIAYSSQEPSDIVFEGYSSFLPARYNYYARNDFSLSQNLYYTNKCLTSFVQFNTAVAVEAVQPYANLDNIHYPTVATVSIPALAKSDKQTGEYLVPEKLGVSYYRGRGYSMRVSGDTLSFVDSISAERLFLDVEKYGPRHRGLTKNDQYSPVVIDDIDSRWMMQSYSSSSAAGTVTDVLNNQKFTPYQSKYEITKRNDSGISRQNDQFDFWSNTDPAYWNKPEKYPLTFRKELLASSYADRKVELLVNKGEMVDWKADIFGNDYGLIKVPGTSAVIPNIKAVSFDTIVTETNTIDLGCGGDQYIGSFPTLSGVVAGGVTLSGAPIIATFPGVSSTVINVPIPVKKSRTIGPRGVGVNACYIGFGAATGALWEAHWIYDFRMVSDYDFINWSQFKSNTALLNNATFIGSDLRLTLSQGGQAGNAYYKQPFYVVDDSNSLIDWSMYMRFSMGGGNRADGLGFIMQSNTTDFGGGGGGIGYAGIPNSIGVMCDTYQNPGDINNNHVELDVNGNVSGSLVVATPTFDLAGPTEPGPMRYMWIDYIGGVFKIFVSDNGSKPGSPLITQALDIRNYLILTQ